MQITSWQEQLSLPHRVYGYVQNLEDELTTNDANPPFSGTYTNYDPEGTVGFGFSGPTSAFVSQFGSNLPDNWEYICRVVGTTYIGAQTWVDLNAPTPQPKYTRGRDEYVYSSLDEFKRSMVEEGEEGGGG